MIGQLDRSCLEAVVVGGGISGLLAAYFLDRAGYQVELFEKSNRVGGLIHSTHTSLGLVESAAHSFLVSPAVERLCVDLGVKLVAVRPHSRARYIWREGRARRVPLKISEIGPTLWNAATRRANVSESVSTNGSQSITVAQWAERHLGSAALHYLVSPFLTGIHAAHPALVYADVAFPNLKVQQGRTLLQTLWALKRNTPRQPRAVMAAPLGGMGSLVQALRVRLSDRLGSRFHTGVCIDRLPEARNVVLAVPAYEAAKLLADADVDFAAALQAIPYTGVVAATVFVDRLPSGERGVVPRGVGVLYPECEQKSVLGVLYNSSAFEGRVTEETKVESFTLLLGGTQRTDILNWTDDRIAETASETLCDLYKTTVSIRSVNIVRQPMALPLYGKELMKVINEARQDRRRVAGPVLFSNYCGALSLRGLIESADTNLGTQPQY